MTPFAAIDFETAGYDPASACSLGIVAANADGAVTEWHRLARRRALRFADLAGETFVMHGTIGFWAPLSRERIPRAKFFLQETLEALRSIVETVALPSFYTDLSLEAVPIPPGKAAIPLRDPEATATYHLVCRADRAAALAPLFAALPSLPAAR
jgi:hypothetical protein